MANDRRINIDELFSDDERRYEAPLETATGELSDGVLDLEPLGRPADDEAIQLVPGSLQLSLRREDEGAFELSLEGTLENRTDGTIALGSLRVALSDVNGALLDSETAWVSTKFTKTQELVYKLDFDLVPPGLLHRVDLYIETEMSFQALLATAQAGPLPVVGRTQQRHAWPLTVEPVEPAMPGYPAFDLDMTAAVGVRWGDPLLGFNIRLTELTPSSDRSREVVVALRDDADKVIAKETVSFRLPYPGHPVIEKIRFYELGRPALSRLTRIDVAAKGNVERVVHLGSFGIRG